MVFPGFARFVVIVGIMVFRIVGGGANISTVLLGPTAATRVVSSSNTQVVVEAARGTAAGGLDVVLTANTGAKSTGSGLWQYLTEGNIATVVPSSGISGTRVTISGTGLRGGGARGKNSRKILEFGARRCARSSGIIL